MVFNADQRLTLDVLETLPKEDFLDYKNYNPAFSEVNILPLLLKPIEHKKPYLESSYKLDEASFNQICCCK